jgi:hypothetical protein
MWIEGALRLLRKAHNILVIDENNAKGLKIVSETPVSNTDQRSLGLKPLKDL